MESLVEYQRISD